MSRPTKYKSRDFDNRYLVAEIGEKNSIKKNKKAISKYERTLLREQLRKEILAED